ncbi:hypothetical protein CPC08DRAFT_381129 [Agrocybe pediades]|nr:hypothetical protein CPC08DRAFT_381129 [Agrocybe pediades]
MSLYCEAASIVRTPALFICLLAFLLPLFSLFSPSFIPCFLYPYKTHSLVHTIRIYHLIGIIIHVNISYFTFPSIFVDTRTASSFLRVVIVK